MGKWQNLKCLTLFLTLLSLGCGEGESKTTSLPSIARQNTQLHKKPLNEPSTYREEVRRTGLRKKALKQAKAFVRNGQGLLAVLELQKIENSRVKAYTVDADEEQDIEALRSEAFRQAAHEFLHSVERSWKKNRWGSVPAGFQTFKKYAKKSEAPLDQYYFLGEPLSAERLEELTLQGQKKRQEAKASLIQQVQEN